MWSFKDHGKSYEAVYERQHPPGFRWVHESFGTNWRMLEMQAAIGRIQLRRMAQWTAARTANAALLAQALQPFAGPAGVVRRPAFACGSGCCSSGGRQAPCSAGCVHAQYKAYAYVRPDKLATGWSRDRIVQEINALGVPCYQGSCSEVYLEKAFDGTGWRPEPRLRVAKELGETSLMWLVHPTLTQAEMARTADVVAQVLRQASVP
jgi:dTDP-4-amino-4,6-dideoxygalactose transaminase